MPVPKGREALLALPGLVGALIPKMVCPLCWPVYAGLLSSLGLGFRLPSRYLLPVTSALLLLSAGTLAFRARQRRGYGPFLLGLAAAGIVLLGKFEVESAGVMYGGVLLLVSASLWNAWPLSTLPRSTGLVQLTRD